MDQRIEASKHKLLGELEKINQIGSLNPDALCNMGKIIDALHHIEEIEMLVEVGEDYRDEHGRPYERYYYGSNGDGSRYVMRRGRTYHRGGHDEYYGNDGDMRAFLEESMHKAANEQERERIRRLMSMT